MRKPFQFWSILVFFPSKDCKHSKNICGNWMFDCLGIFKIWISSNDIEFSRQDNCEKPASQRLFAYFLFEWRFLRQGLCDIFHTPKIDFFLVLKCKQKNIRTTRAGREKTGVFSFYPVPRLKIVKIWPQNIHHAGHCYLNNMRFTGLPLFIPLDVTPVLSCHFFGSIEHLIPEVSEALQNSWLASSFFHVFLEGGCPVFLGSYFLPPWFSIWIINYLVILSEATIEFFVARDSWLSPQEIHPLPILLVKFHYFSQLTLTTSIPTCCTSDVFFVHFYCSQEIQVTQDFGGSTHSPLCHHDLNASQL